MRRIEYLAGPGDDELKCFYKRFSEIEDEFVGFPRQQQLLRLQYNAIIFSCTLRI